MPWFDLYDEAKRDVRVSEPLYSIKSVILIDKMKGLLFQQDDASVKIKGGQLRHLTWTAESRLDLESDRAFKELFWSK